MALSTASPASGQESSAPAVGLHEAALLGNVDAVRQHVAASADLDAIDQFGSSPLIVATTFGHAAVVEALLEGGADASVPNRDGSTPLHIAALFGRTEIVRSLLDHGANRYLRNHEGRTPADSVAGPFDDVVALYDLLGARLGPLGLRLDYDDLRAARPAIEAMLRPPAEALAAVDYAPLEPADWPVSTPEAQGLDSAAVAEMFLGASAMDRIRGVLVVRNGNLVAEGYFNGWSADQVTRLQSVTKSVTSALVGVALERGCLPSLDQRMLDFFPELADGVSDPRKQQITLRQMLQMRAGFPWEETDPTYWDALLSGSYLGFIDELPLVDDPGTAFHYSNLTSHWLGIIVARTCETDLRSLAEESLFTPLGIEAGEWLQDADGYNIGHGTLRLTARDAARFGLLYLEGGELGGRRLLAEDWVRDSLQAYSHETYDDEWRGETTTYVSPYLDDIGYGYQWWSARVGGRDIDYAWGHGGQLVVLVDDLDLVVVVISDPFWLQHDEVSWRYEQANFNLIGRFIDAL